MPYAQMCQRTSRAGSRRSSAAAASARGGRGGIRSSMASGGHLRRRRSHSSRCCRCILCSTPGSEARDGTPGRQGCQHVSNSSELRDAAGRRPADGLHDKLSCHLAATAVSFPQDRGRIPRRQQHSSCRSRTWCCAAEAVPWDPGLLSSAVMPPFGSCRVPQSTGRGGRGGRHAAAKGAAAMRQPRRLLQDQSPRQLRPRHLQHSNCCGR